VCRDGDGVIDCAVIGGMYRGISNDLKRCDLALRVASSRGWFCHAQRGHACRGNALNQGRAVMRAMEAVASDDAEEHVRSANGAEPTHD
jgi:hypothetical protein